MNCKICTAKDCDCLCSVCKRARRLVEDADDTYGEDLEPRYKRLTRNERLQGLADRGTDTWDEYEEKN